MNALMDQLEQVTSAEHAALIGGDWRALAACAELKPELADRLESSGLDEAARRRLLSLRAATEHNMALAESLSRQVAALLSSSTPKITYNYRGAVAPSTIATVSVRG